MIIINGWKALTIITKRSILNVAAVLDPPLNYKWLECEIFMILLKHVSGHLSVFFQYRNNYRRCSVGKGVLRNFVRFTGKHLRKSLLNITKKVTLAQLLSYEFREISKNTFFYRIPPDDCFFQYA